jgi:hypothetical protein
MAGGDDCNSVVSLEESYPSSYCDRAETLDPDGTDRSVDVSPRARANYSPGVPLEPGSQRPCRCEGGHRSFHQCGSDTAPPDPDLVAHGNASRIRSSFPPWIMRRVSRRSVYIPAVDTRRQEQVNCILRDRENRRGEILQTDDETASPTFHVEASTASIRAMLLWMAHVRPDLSAFVSIVASITKATFVSKDHMDAMNEKILTLKATAHVGLQFTKLDYDSLRLVTYVDGFFANREDKSSQIGYLICWWTRMDVCAFCRIVRVGSGESVDQRWRQKHLRS